MSIDANSLGTVHSGKPLKATARQREVLTLGSLAVVLDGFDNQLLGFSIPSLVSSWQVDKADFVPVIALSLIAMSVGTAAAGRLGDRWGRRPMLIASIAVFGLATLLTVMCKDVANFTVFRVIAALGLGGAMPNAVALLSEFAPQGRRSFAVTFGMICTPIGGVIAGLTAAQTLEPYGWQSLYIIGGIFPLLFCGLLLLRLPESPDYLARRAVAHPVQNRKDRFANKQSDTGFGSLFSKELRRDTLLIWGAFLCTLTAAYCVFNWVPTLLSKVGYDLAIASTALAAFNFGGIAGAFLGALQIDKLGSKGLTIGAAAGGVLVCAGAASLFGPSLGGWPVIAILAAAGLFIAGLQPMLFAVAANIYPDTNRASGVGAALAVGRLGAVASSALGSVLITVGAWAYFGFLAALMLLAMITMLLISRHVRVIKRVN